jgi:O-antigen biosynthesis protein
MFSQSFTEWEWCLVDDCSTRPEVHDALDEIAKDPRVRLIRRSANGGIVAASNDAIAAATAPFIGLLDHDDALVPTALADVMAVLDSPIGDDIGYLYTDEAHVLIDGREAAHFLKPDWSPERFRSSMYTCHLSVLRHDVVQAIGGFRAGFDGSQDHDLILRATEQASKNGQRVFHLPALTYHWRNISSSVSRASDSLLRAIENGRRAVQEQCDRTGINAEVIHGPIAGCYRVVRHVPDDLPVTVVVPTRLEAASQRPYRLAAESTLRQLQTSHPAARLVVAYPADTPAELVALLDDCAGDRWLQVPVAGPWSLANAIDRALLMYPAAAAVTLAPGMVPRSDATPDWLEALVGLALDPGAGLAGALIADRNDVVLHAGWDVPNYRFYELEGLPVATSTSGNDLLIERECSHVTLAVAAVSLQHWREFRHLASGGFDDAGRRLSQALTDSGARTLWTPYARVDRAVTIDG